MKKIMAITAILMSLALTACATNTKNMNVQSVPKAVSEEQIPLYKCGYYICATITLCATHDDCQTVPKMIVDTGSAGVRVFDDALNKKIRSDFKKTFEKLGHVHTKTTFVNNVLKSEYSKAYSIKIGEVEAKNRFQYVEIAQPTLWQKINWNVICGCNGLLGISAIEPDYIDEITQKDNVTHILTVKWQFGNKESELPVAIMQNPIAFKSFTINFTKTGAVLDLAVHAKRAPGQIQKKVYNTIVDTGSPLYNITVKGYGKLLGLMALSGKVYFYLNATRVGDTVFYPRERPKK